MAEGLGSVPSDRERIASNSAQLAGLREDVRELRQESARTRTRLHNLEGIAGTLVEQEKVRREMAGARQRSLEVRIQVLTVVVGVAAVVSPFLYNLAGGH